MIQLAYISSVARPMEEAEMAELLAASRRSNAIAGVTGLLLHDGRRFLQALEGDRAAVDSTHRRIAADPRHRAIVLLSSREVGARDFGEWSMAAERIAPTQGRMTVASQVDALAAGCTDPDIRALFRSFAQVRAAA